MSQCSYALQKSRYIKIVSIKSKKENLTANIIESLHLNANLELPPLELSTKSKITTQLYVPRHSNILIQLFIFTILVNLFISHLVESKVIIIYNLKKISRFDTSGYCFLLNVQPNGTLTVQAASVGT